MKNIKTYKCNICGNVISLNHESNGSLHCCGKPMNLLEINYSENGSGEKHVPIIEKITENTYKITVGSILHPMTEEHYIEYIDIFTEKNEKITVFLNKNEKPEVVVEVKNKIFFVNAYCNLHGLWGKKL